MVSSIKLRPFIEYLLTIYEDVDTLSSASGIPKTTLNDIQKFKFGISDKTAQVLVQFLLNHRRVNDMFATYENGMQPRYATQKEREEAKKMDKLLKSERRKYGW